LLKRPGFIVLAKRGPPLSPGVGGCVLLFCSILLLLTLDLPPLFLVDPITQSMRPRASWFVTPTRLLFWCLIPCHEICLLEFGLPCFLSLLSDHGFELFFLIFLVQRVIYWHLLFTTTFRPPIRLWKIQQQGLVSPGPFALPRRFSHPPPCLWFFFQVSTLSEHFLFQWPQPMAQPWLVPMSILLFRIFFSLSPTVPCQLLHPPPQLPVQ